MFEEGFTFVEIVAVRKDSANAYIRAWRSANPDKVRAYNRKHVAKVRSIKQTKARKKSRQTLKTE